MEANKQSKINEKFSELESLFDYVTPEEMRRTITKLFFSWLIENKDFPKDIREQVEHVWFLIDYLERK